MMEMQRFASNCKNNVYVLVFLLICLLCWVKPMEIYR